MSTATAATPGPAPESKPGPGRIQLRPAPVREPPFDDERPRRLSVIGRYDRPLPFDRVPPSQLRLTRTVDPFEPQPTARDQLPDPELFIRRFLIAVVEVVTGRRSVSQLAPYTSPSLQAGLARDVGHLDRLGTARRPAVLHSVHCREPADGVIEAAAVLRCGPRYRAIALRLEGLDGRWRCIRLQIG